ncbi:I78 family peptidase inhibitor [Stappia sp.]|uniref:I78 family peptidase inhibitor n=1 Tax=Stappia sp. TaxID=1870903 RepID=UPI0032D91200
MNIVISLTEALPALVACRTVADDAVYPGIYSQVFGPADPAACERFIADNCGKPGEASMSADAGALRLAGAIAAATNTVADLVGRPLRVYTTGDLLTDDYVPDRVNIEQDATGVIVKIWFG